MQYFHQQLITIPKLPQAQMPMLKAGSYLNIGWISTACCYRFYKTQPQDHASALLHPPQITPIQARKMGERFAAILTPRVICIRIALKNINAATAILKTTELMHAPSSSNSSQVFRTYTVYSLYFSTFFPFSIFLYQNTLATMHYSALIHWFVFQLLILQKYHSFNLFPYLFFRHGVYCFVIIQGHFICDLCWFYNLVAFLDIQAYLYIFIQKISFPHFWIFRSSYKNQRKIYFQNVFSCYSETSYYFIAAWPGPKTQWQSSLYLPSLISSRLICQRLYIKKSFTFMLHLFLEDH